jgi:hypothetical protein
MTIADTTHALRLDLEELSSRGFGHQDANTIVGRMRVALDQIDGAAGEPPPPADPVQDQLSRLNMAVAGLAEAVGPVLQRQTDVANEVQIVSAGIARLSDLVVNLGNLQASGLVAAPQNGPAAAA